MVGIVKCKAAKRDIYRWVDKELKGAEEEALEEHLGQCSFCQKELESIQSFDQVLKAAPGKIDLSGNFERVFWEKISNREKKPLVVKLLRDFQSFLPALNLSQALAALVISFFIGGASGVVFTTTLAQQLPSQRASIHYLSGFREFKGVPETSMAGSYLKGTP